MQIDSNRPSKRTESFLNDNPPAPSSSLLAFQQACNQNGPEGVAAVGKTIGYADSMPTALNDELKWAVDGWNSGKPLQKIIISDSSLTLNGKRSFDAKAVVDIASKYMAPGGTIILAQAAGQGASPATLQALADKTGLTIIAGSSSMLDQGTVTYQKGKPPLANPNGIIDDGGIGRSSGRGCVK